MYRDGKDQRHWEQQQQHHHQVKRSLAAARFLAAAILHNYSMQMYEAKKQAEPRPYCSRLDFQQHLASVLPTLPRNRVAAGVAFMQVLP
jgi:hypothetical protein